MKLVKTFGRSAKAAAALIEAIERRGAVSTAKVERVVSGVLADVRRHGDEAVLEYATRFDQLREGASLLVSREEMKAAWEQTSPGLRKAMEVARENIRGFAEAQKPTEWMSSPMDGLKIVLLTPIELTEPERAKGCFGINAICEFGQSDDDVTAALSVSGRILHIALVDLVREAQAKGEIGAAIDPAVATGLIQVLLSGVKVAARAGTAPDSMRKVIDLALGALEA